jgi:hypothetical protein
VRFLGPYQEAVSRLNGRHVAALTRASNRFWMGQPRMMFADGGSEKLEKKNPKTR